MFAWSYDPACILPRTAQSAAPCPRQIPRKKGRASPEIHKVNITVDNGNLLDYYCDQHSEYYQPK